MCQEIIFKQLRMLRVVGIHDYLTMAEIEKLVLSEHDISPVTIRQKVNKLYAFGFLDVLIPKGKKLMYYRRKFRIKNKYITITKGVCL